MKNITVSVGDEVYHRARVYAAEHGTSISAVVRDLLETITLEETEAERLQRLEVETVARIASRRGEFSAANRLTREEAHDRDALR